MPLAPNPRSASVDRSAFSDRDQPGPEWAAWIIGVADPVYGDQHVLGGLFDLGVVPRRRLAQMRRISGRHSVRNVAWVRASPSCAAAIRLDQRISELVLSDCGVIVGAFIAPLARKGISIARHQACDGDRAGGPRHHTVVFPADGGMRSARRRTVAGWGTPARSDWQRFGHMAHILRTPIQRPTLAGMPDPPYHGGTSTAPIGKAACPI